MSFRAAAVLITAAVPLMSACQQQAKRAQAAPVSPVIPSPVAASPAPAPEPTAAPSTPTISLANGSTTLTVNPVPTPCGAEKLTNYANLLPTSMAKDEIARTVGHQNIRYVPLKTPLDADESGRLTAELGVDGRIKKFVCG